MTRTSSIKWKALAVGAAAFLAAHAVVAARWARWFGGEHEPWFLNSGRAVAFTAFCLLLAGLGASAWWARDRDDAMVHGLNVAAGAVLAMVIMLVAVGPGSIFPIVIAFGGMIALVSAGIGSSIVRAFKPRSARSV